MAYSEKSNFLERIKTSEYDKLTAVSLDDELTPDDIIDEAIATADSIIDSYLENVVTSLPLSTPPKSIVQASVDIAIYNLHSRIQYIDIPEFVSVRYNTCIQWLKDVAKGVANIQSSAISSETLSDTIIYETERNVFGSDTF